MKTNKESFMVAYPATITPAPSATEMPECVPPSKIIKADENK